MSIPIQEFACCINPESAVGFRCEDRKRNGIKAFGVVEENSPSYSDERNPAKLLLPQRFRDVVETHGIFRVK